MSEDNINQLIWGVITLGVLFFVYMSVGRPR